MRWVAAVLRRFLAPALIGGVLANVAVYRMLESEGALSDWKSIGVLSGIILAGLIVGWPCLVLLRRLRLHPVLLALALLALGTLIGAVAAYLIAMQIVPDTADEYIKFGLVVGPLAALFWLILNYDVLRPIAAQQSGDRRG